MGKIIITIILVNIEITIIFEFETVIYSVRLSGFLFLELRALKCCLKEIHKMVKKKTFHSKMINRYVSSCSALSIKH